MKRFASLLGFLAVLSICVALTPSPSPIGWERVADAADTNATAPLTPALSPSDAAWKSTGGPVQTVIDALTGKFGWFPKALSIFVFVMGLLRTVFKPVMTWIEARVKETADESDDRKLEAFERGPVYKALCWALDFSASIKVGTAKK